MKNPLLCRAARPERGREASERFLMETLGRTQSKRYSVAQIVWNKSTRRAGERGGARGGRPRWLRILTITGGSSIAALRRGLRTGDDLQSAAAVGAVFDVDVEDPFEQPGPAHARCLSLRVSVLAWGLGGRRCRAGNDFTAQLRIGRQHAMEADQMEPRARHQRRQALHELQRLHDDMGGAVFVRTLQLQHNLAGAIALEPLVGDGRPGDVAAELLQFFTLIGAPARRRMEAKAVRVDTQL